MAIASYERTLYSDDTPLDRDLTGGPPLPPLEQQGRQVFVANSCSACHGGALLSDDRFHYIGVRPVGEDLGRFEVSGVPVDRGAFRTPSLRNVGLRPRYMHEGRFSTLEEVVDFYDRGGDFTAPNISPLIQPLFLTPAQKTALVAFLSESLTDPRVAVGEAPFDHPGLYGESGLVPSLEGDGVTGSGGFVPQAIALEPAMTGNPSFTVAVQGALGGAEALLAIDTVDPGLEPPVGATFAWQPLTLAGTGEGDGYGSVSLAIPDDPSLVGLELVGRWYVSDPGAPGLYAVSRAFRFVVFPPRLDLLTTLFVDGFESGDSGRWSSHSP